MRDGASSVQCSDINMASGYHPDQKYGGVDVEELTLPLLAVAFGRPAHTIPGSIVELALVAQECW